MKICEYGCEQEAIFPPKKGMRKWCCSDDYRKCPSRRTYKGFTNNEKIKIKKNNHHIYELDGTIINIKNPFKTRRIFVSCIECHNTRNVSLSDYLICKTNLCFSCCRKGDRNVSKRSDVRVKLSRKGVKDTSYATPEWRLNFSLQRRGKNNPNYGKKDSVETRRKKRLATLKNIEERIRCGGQIIPAYNKEACKLIDEYGIKYNYVFQHAMNGGEFHIKELGYWVDGYDKEKNVVIEIDEGHHFDVYGKLKERDKRRQKEIEKFLKCKFIRLKYRSLI